MLAVIIGIVAVAAILFLWWFCSDDNVPKTTWADWEHITPKPLPMVTAATAATTVPVDTLPDPVPAPVLHQPVLQSLPDSAPAPDLTSSVIEHPPLEPPDGWVPPYFNAKTSEGERITCQALADIYGVPFTSVWPQWLLNPDTGKRMQLDCYNHQLRIAAEYNGMQHYEYPNTFHKSLEEFERQRRRDEHKRDICDRLGIYLITVNHLVPYGAIPQYVLSQTPEQQLLQQAQYQGT